MSRKQIAQGAYPTRPQVQETALEKAVRAPLDLIWRAAGAAKRQWNQRSLSPELWSRMDQAWLSIAGKHLPPDLDQASACLQAGYWLDTGLAEHDEALTAVTAAVFALERRRVHIVEESLSEADADIEKLIRFWRGLGLSAARHEGNHAGANPYNHDILVVPLTTLMSDFLHDVIKVGDPRNLQSFHTAALSLGGRAGDQWRLKGLDVLIFPRAASFAVDRPHSTATLTSGGVAKSTLGRVTLHRFLSRYRTIAVWDAGLDVVAAGLWTMYRKHVVRWPNAPFAPTRFICRRNLADAVQEISAFLHAAANEGQPCSIVATAERLAKFEVEAAEMDFKTRQLVLKQAEKALERRTIRSPVDGVVIQRMLAAGEFVYEQSPILEIAEIDPLFVETFLPINLYKYVRGRETATVVPAPPVEGRFTAKITVVDQVFDAASGTFGVRLLLDNPDGALPAGVPCLVYFD